MKDETRTLSLMLSSPVDEMAVRAVYADNDAVTALTVEADQLRIDYLFPRTHRLALIAALLPLAGDLLTLTWRQRIQNQMEQNEREHALVPGGWTVYVRNLYVEHGRHQHYERSANIKRLWEARAGKQESDA